MFRISPTARPNANRIGMRMVPTAGLFVFGFALLQAWDRALHKVVIPVRSSPQLQLHVIGAILFLVLGILGCVWPLKFMERAVPAIRGRISELDSRLVQRIVLIGKCFGVTFLLASCFLFRQTAP